MRRRATLAGLIVGGLLAAGGCGPAHVPMRPPPPVDAVGYMLMPTYPIPVNWDGRAGADGLAVQVYLFRPPAGSLPLTVTGTLEFALYEGKPAPEELERIEPLRRWRFAGEARDACRVRSAYGWGYAMRLPWGNEPPATSSVTLTARYVPPEGKGAPVHADPTRIAIGPR